MAECGINEWRRFRSSGNDNKKASKNVLFIYQCHSPLLQNKSPFVQLLVLHDER